MLSIAIGALQLMLDRGSQLDWFSSGEIIIETIIAAGAFYLLIVHMLTSENSFVNPRLFLDRNFASACCSSSWWASCCSHHLPC